MSTSDLVKFSGGSQDKGIDTFEPDISAEVTWDESTYNVSGGIRRGVGVRYGVAPLAGHSNTETPPGNETNGLMKSEAASGGAGLINRELIFGIVPLTMAAYDGAYPKANHQYYAYLVGLDNSSSVCLDVCVGATLVSTVNKQASDLRAGLAESSYREESPLVRRHKTELLNLPQITTPTAANMRNVLSAISGRYWMPYAHISISGKRVPYQWMLGDIIDDPDATHTPSINIWTASSTAGTSQTIYCGAPSEIITREALESATRVFSVFCLDANLYKIDIKYTATITAADTTAVTAYGTSAMYNAVTATKTGASTSYSSVEGVIINDPGSFTNSRHDAILIAGEIPLAIIYQDWLVAVKGMMPRWVDLSNPACNPRNGLSVDLNNSNNASGFSFESGSFNYGFSQQGANTGFLRKDVTYDIGFSYYNKLIDYETNVTFGRQITILTTDFESLVVGAPLAGAVENVWESMQTTATGRNAPWEYSDAAPKTGVEAGRGFSINDYQIKYYYRETGTSEWFVAGVFDAAQLWFSYQWSQPSGIGAFVAPTICQAPSGALPGGQPNGFIDYSPLPKSRYICTVIYQNRAFWWSEKSMQFSLQNNIYAYPTRNIITGATGKWRGGIVHIRSGQVEQTSRLVVFADVAYVGRFTGDKTAQNVRISSDTVGQFEIDGSDFRLDYLCEATAFSFRAACVANGVLYFWGPQGVYRDDGVTEPEKISGLYEPNIFAFVDMGRDSEVHCVYSKRTSEVIWFYPPKVTESGYPTYGLVYNVENGKFYNYKFKSQVDASQQIKIENDDTPDGVDGERILLHCRDGVNETVSRTYFFDDLVFGGDQGPNREFLIKTISTPASGQRRLTLAAGSRGITSGNVEVNDLVCFQNVKGYATSLTTATDMIAKIIAVNNGAGTLDIQLPDDGDIDGSATLAEQLAFPIYQKKPTAAGLHGIVYLLRTTYWLPGGLSESWQWLYLYFLFKYGGIPTPTNVLTGLPSGEQITLGYRTVYSGGYVSDTLSLINNSDDHCQIWHPMRNVELSASGQALKYMLSGIHIGDPWTLEYLEAHCLKEKGYTLKQFEG